MNEKTKDPSSYVFSGVVLPERARLDLYQPILGGYTNADAELNGTIWISIIKNQIVVLANLDSKPTNTRTLGNMVTDVVHLVTDCVCLQSNTAYHVDLRSVLNLQSREMLVLAPDFPSAQDDPSSLSEFNLFPMFEVAGTKPLIARALSDYRSAIARPQDTGFHCYRAIESLLHVFGEEVKSKSKPSQIRALESSLNVESDCIKRLRELGGEVRHGKIAWISANERRQALDVTKEIIGRAIKYLEPAVDKQASFSTFKLPPLES